MSTRGFTLLELLVALAIAATALVVVAGRFGASSDLQRALHFHALSLDIALDQLQRQPLKEALATGKREGDLSVRDANFHWRIEHAPSRDLPGFYRKSIEVTDPDGASTKLFVYRSMK